MTTSPPRAIRSATLKLGGVEICVHVLEDGRRVIEDFDVETALGAATPEQINAMARFIARGLDPEVKS